MDTDINKMNETELRDYIRKFADVVYNYDKLRDEELDFLDEHPERGMWDEEMEEEYDNLLKDISDNWDKIRVFFKEIDADKYFTF